MARGDARGFGVRLSESAVHEARRKIDRGRREHRGAGVASGNAAVVGERVAAPEDAARLSVERDDRAAERRVWPRRSRRGHTGVDGVAGEDRRAGHDALRVRMHLGHPAELSGLRIDAQHVRMPEVADHQRVARDRWTRARDVARDPRVVRH